MGDVATFQRLYDDAVSVAGRLWDGAQREGKPDPGAGRGIVDSLAQAVAQNRTALLALTALKNYDNYTFTHMVNVSILTMGQARGARDRRCAAAREFGLAALMHDIGKVKTPTEILNKPDKLDDREFEIMKRHTVDGAEILRRTPEIPTLAPIVAFEHHLRLDGSGYPNGVIRGQLNLATMLCGVADVYDAMRSQRHYQQAFPTDRILAVLQRNDGKQFDQNLDTTVQSARRYLSRGQSRPLEDGRAGCRAEGLRAGSVPPAREGASRRRRRRSRTAVRDQSVGDHRRASRPRRSKRRSIPRCMASIRCHTCSNIDSPACLGPRP